jgi:hypothetical protein
LGGSRAQASRVACGLGFRGSSDGPLLLLWFVGLGDAGLSTLSGCWGATCVIEVAAGWFIPPVYYFDSWRGWFRGSFKSKATSRSQAGISIGYGRHG